jgi:regulator of sigma E protease
MSSLLPFLFVLGVLVFVHELGHFIVARWHGVRVLTFSLGFGPKLFSFKRGDTEYCISIIPLGGYVKMAGEPSDYITAPTVAEGKSDEFMAKTKWQRFQIYLAGPVMNAILALIVMTFVFYAGATEFAYLKRPAVIGSVQPNSAAEKAGIKAGDQITSVAGKPIDTWDRLDFVVMPRAGQELPVTIRRNGQDIALHVTPDTRTKYEMGDLGVNPELHPQIKGVNAGEPAERAGLQVGDVVLAVNGEKVDYTISSDGLKDRLKELINASPDKPMTLTVTRKGQNMDVTVTPEKKDGVGMIGVSYDPGEKQRIEPTLSRAFTMSVNQNLEWSTLIFQTFGNLFVGKASIKQLSGPVGIAKLSGQAASMGWASLFMVMCMISLNLGIINLLPIPMLDGGHIFIMAMEGIARRDFSVRMKEKMLMAGFLVIMLLMVTVLYNDLMRIDWIERLVPWR